MNEIRYELQTYSDPEYPLIFHYDHLQNGLSITPHWHMNLELLYVQRGSISVTLENRKVVASRGQIVVINTNEIHSVESLTTESYYFCLIIDTSFCKKLGFDVMSSQYQSITEDLELKNIFQLIINEGTLQKIHYKKAIRALCNTLLILLERNLVKSEPRDSSELLSNDNIAIVRKLLRTIQQNPEKDFSLDDLAASVAISKFHMCRIFKEITLITINQYITQVRLERSKEMLTENELSIADIAESCGFASLSYFTKTYKKHFGHSPSQFKKVAPQVSKEIFEVNRDFPVESSNELSVTVSKYI